MLPNGVSTLKVSFLICDQCVREVTKLRTLLLSKGAEILVPGKEVPHT